MFLSDGPKASPIKELVCNSSDALFYQPSISTTYSYINTSILLHTASLMKYTINSYYNLIIWLIILITSSLVVLYNFCIKQNILSHRKIQL